jgi:hypothetical protein
MHDDGVMAEWSKAVVLSLFTSPLKRFARVRTPVTPAISFFW